ncbi:MAG TPA: hypothetical protein V6D48_20255 [Oculatellaceae cyanobacterium]
MVPNLRVGRGVIYKNLRRSLLLTLWLELASVARSSQEVRSPFHIWRLVTFAIA